MTANRYGLTAKKYLQQPEFDYFSRLISLEPGEISRDKILLSLAVATGARASELLLARKSDIDRHFRSILIHGTKGSNDREIPLKPRLFASVIRYVDSLSGDQLFPISYHRLRQIWVFYRPSEKKFHSLRHTFAIRLYLKTRDVRLVQVALGHRSILNTLIYADYAFTQNELRRALL